MPPHNGHLFLINSAIKQCEKVVILICSLQNEPINGFLRWTWLKTIFEGQKNVEIIHVEDENPQKPEECDSIETFYHQYWVPTVYKRIPKLDVVFTSEVYGEEFAMFLGIKHVLVDIDRVVHPISGTLVRKDAYTNWVHIPPIVQQYYSKRIVILGPESTGKTTLAKNLAQYYSSTYVEEYGRTYCETIKEAKLFDKDDFYNIAIKHSDDVLNAHDKLIFVDTEALTTKIFGEMYLNDYHDERIDEIIKHQHYDLYLVMDIDVPWINDGTRDFPNDRDKHLNRITKGLDELNQKYILISGNYEERFNKARSICDTYIKG